jgi:protein-S-isoprenylcysteine O-methyltransferase Ste14
MTIYSWLIVAFWAVFVTIWAIMAVSTKRNVGRRNWGKEIGLRLIAFAVIVVIIRIPSWRYALGNIEKHAAGNPILGVIGVALCALGIGFAIWARVYIGRNWGIPMSRKENPELITSGPYAFVRHPIYTGMIFAMLGSALAVNVSWALMLLLFGGYFVYSATREEAFMTEQFPDAYPAYRKRTKMLLPFVL